MTEPSPKPHRPPRAGGPPEAAALGDPSNALARATISQAHGSLLRIVHFRSGEIVYDRDDQLVLSMGFTANHRLIYETGRLRVDAPPMIGRFGVMTPGRRFRVTLVGDCSVIQLVLPKAVLEGWLAEDHEVDPARLELAWGHSLDDPQVSRWLCAARLAGAEGESACLRAVAARLFARGAALEADRPRARGGLPAHKLRRVVDAIEADPAREITVEALAGEVAMSPFHFAHQFRAATGRAPHRFVVERRLARAVEMLATTSLPAADVAIRCGFAHASHLSRQMQRVLGLSPARIRRAVAGAV